MGWTNDANNTPFAQAVKPMPALRGVAHAGLLDVMIQSKKPRPWVAAGAGCLRPDVRGCPDASDPARRWLAIGKDGVRHAPATIPQMGRPRRSAPGTLELRGLLAERFDLSNISSLRD